MAKGSELNKQRLIRVSGVILVIGSLFGLAMIATGHSSPQDFSSFRKVPVPKKVEEVLGIARGLLPGQKSQDSGDDQESGGTSPSDSRSLSLTEVKEEAQEKVVTESKEVVREKTTEILRELIEKLSEKEEVEGEEAEKKVCRQVCEEVCQEAHD